MNNMNFANKVKEIIEATSDYKVEIKEVTKNNERKIGIIRKDEDGICPTFYTDQFEDEDKMAEFVINFREEKPSLEGVEKTMETKETILNQIKLKIVNAERNQNKRIGKDLGNGLKAEFYVQVLNGAGSITITEEVAEAKNITVDEMYEKALENMKNDVKVMSLSKMFFGDEDIMPSYVITNNRDMYGAGTILLKEVQERIQEKIGDYFILPCSVHEVIVLPKENLNGMKGIVKAVNREVLDETEFLSDDVFYITDEGNLAIA